MTTLFQLHANLDTLKSVTKDMATLWQPKDSILLLGATSGYLDWFKAYISDINIDEESEKRIDNITAIYLLKDDIEGLNDSAKLNLNVSSPTDSIPVKIVNDMDWVLLTQQMDKTITLTSTTL